MVSARAKPGAGFVCAIGNFDGVHRGHQYLLNETAAVAQSIGARPGVLLFEPHPRRYFQPDAPPFLLTAPKERDRLLISCGAETVLPLTFNETLASTSPESFVQDILVKEMGLAGVVTGGDFRFGARRAGDSGALRALGEESGLTVRIISVLNDGGDAEKFGSSAVRRAIREGRMDDAAKMLGRSWSISGIVEEGRRLGRTLGFPTANVHLGDLVEPKAGVYAVMVQHGGERYQGVANFGRRPTVGAPAPLLEAHLFDFSGDLYGDEINVEFVDFIRPEQKFDGLDDLKAQIEQDCMRAHERLAAMD